MHKRFAETFKTAFNAGLELTAFSAIEGGKLEGNLPGAIAMALAPVAGGLQTVAMALAGNEAAEDDWRPSEDQSLFAALFVAVIVRNGSSLDFQPATFLEAFHMFEKLTGRKPDSFLFEQIATATREVEKEGAGPLAAFMEARHNGTTH